MRTRVGKAFPSPPNCLGENAVTAASADDERPPAPRSENGANYARSSQFDRCPANNERNAHGEADPPAQLAYDLSVWMLFPLCRDGCISPLEADHLFGYFVQWIHPFFPVIDHKYSSPNFWRELLAEETLLCATILMVAARYSWYNSSASSSRAVEMHGMMYQRVQSDIQSFLWSSTPPSNRNSTALGVIESIMLMVEWHPRPLDVILPPSAMPGEYPLRAFGFSDETAKSSVESEALQTYESFKSLNLTSWRLLGPAINLADEIGLHEVVTQAKETDPRDDAQAARRAHVRDLLVSLVFGKTVPLGRKCLLPHPIRPSGAPEPDPFEALLISWSELYRLVRLIDGTLYPSAGTTAEIISSERYPSIVDDFSSLLASWRTRFESTAGSATFAKYVDVIAHSTRSWLYCVALQAFVRRCQSSTRNSRNLDERSSTTLQECMRSERSRQDLEMVDVMVHESKRTLEIVLELHQESSLRHAPLNIMTNIASTTMLLLGSQRLPLRTAAGSLALLNRVAKALEEASIDDAHALSQYAACLKRLVCHAQTENSHSTDNSSYSVFDANALETNNFWTSPDAFYAFEGIDPALMCFPHVPFVPFSDDQFMVIPAQDQI